MCMPLKVTSNKIILRRKQPVRILHILGGMNRGGAETWLMHVLRNIDRDRYYMDFLVHTEKICDYDREIQELGSRVIPCLHPSHPFEYAKNFRRVLRDYGPYDVVHSHVHHFSGYTLKLAHKEGVPGRIAHAHSGTSAVDSQANLWRRCYLRVMKGWIHKYATIGLAASRSAAAALYGPCWEKNSRWRIHYCAIDMEPFHMPADRAAIREELNIPSNAFVLGHVGRFTFHKNHALLLEIAAEVAEREPNMRLLLIGDGPLRRDLEKRIGQLRLVDKVILAGIRSDVPRLILGAMDVFIMPSVCEGLPLVGIEAQAAGLPIIFSDIITDEIDMIKSLIWRLSLSQPASAWAEAVLEARNGAKTFPKEEILAVVEKKAFNIQTGLKDLIGIYDRELH